MPLYDTLRYLVVYDEEDGKWKVQNENGRTLSTHNKKSRAKQKGKNLAKNRADRTSEAVRFEVYKKSGQNQYVRDYNRSRRARG